MAADVVVIVLLGQLHLVVGYKFLMLVQILHTVIIIVIIIWHKIVLIIDIYVHIDIS